MNRCPYCGSKEITYLGIDDGLGDYGDSLCDTWHCEHCDNEFESGCIDIDDSELEEIN